MLDCGLDPAADWADTWRPLVGAVFHAAWARADVAPWTGCMGPRRTGHLTLKGYLIWSASSRSDDAGRMETAGHRGRHTGWWRHGRRRAKLGGGRRRGRSGPHRVKPSTPERSTSACEHVGGATEARRSCLSGVPWWRHERWFRARGCDILGRLLTI